MFLLPTDPCETKFNHRSFWFKSCFGRGVCGPGGEGEGPLVALDRPTGEFDELAIGPSSVIIRGLLMPSRNLVEYCHFEESTMEFPSGDQVTLPGSFRPVRTERLAPEAMDIRFTDPSNLSELI